MKHIYLTTTFVICALFSISIAQAQTVLSGGESWSAYDVLDFEDGVAGRGLAGTNPMTNSGSNGGTWNTNSQAGKFVTNNSGFAVTDGDAATWGRSISYSAISTGKWRLVLDIGAYDLTTFDNMTGINDLSLELRNGGTAVSTLSFRIHDDTGSDGVADGTQVSITNDNTIQDFAFSGKDSDMTATNNQVWDFVAVEFDFTTGNVFMERNGVVVRGTGVSGAGNDTGVIAFSSFDQLRLSANGDWASSTADTGVLETDLIGLYTAIPEPSSAALILLAGGALWFLRRKRQ
jgi:hypothetical protein